MLQVSADTGGPASVLSSDDLTDFGVEWFKGTPSTAQRFTLRITRSLHREAVALLLMPIPVACWSFLETTVFFLDWIADLPDLSITIKHDGLALLPLLDSLLTEIGVCSLRIIVDDWFSTCSVATSLHTEGESESGTWVVFLYLISVSMAGNQPWFLGTTAVGFWSIWFYRLIMLQDTDFVTARISITFSICTTTLTLYCLFWNRKSSDANRLAEQKTEHINLQYYTSQLIKLLITILLFMQLMYSFLWSCKRLWLAT